MVVYPYPAEEEDRIVFISYSNTRTHALVNGTKAVFDFITKKKLRRITSNIIMPI